MTEKTSSLQQPSLALLPDDPLRKLVTASRHESENPLVGDTYTILLTGKDTAGRFCLIDMYVFPGGGPPPHRHDFEETFILLEGELDVVFRGASQVVLAGGTVPVPAEAPHQFHNSSTRPAALAPKYRMELLQHA